jgi:hypothetical protein
MMSEEKFFQKVQSELSGYSPEVPAHVYAGMRRKYGWAKFTTWNATTWNVWYLVMLLGISSGIAYGTASSMNTDSTHAKRGLSNPVEAPVLEAVNTSATTSCVANHAADCSAATTACSSSKSASQAAATNETSLDNTSSTIVEASVSASTSNNDIVDQTEETAPTFEEATPEVLNAKPKKKLKVNVYKERN